MRVAEVNDTYRNKHKLTSENGLVILEVDPNSPAAYENGLREGDMLIEINLHSLKTLDDIAKAVKDSDKKIIVEFEREGTVNYQAITKKEK